MLEKLKKMIKNHYDALVVEVEKELKAKMKKERNREDAKRNCLIEKRAKQTSAGRISFLLWFGWIIATLVFAAAISGVLFFLGLTFKFQAAAFFLIPIIINTIV